MEKFKDIWLQEAKLKFTLSNIDALKYLNQFAEEFESENQNQNLEPIYDEVDIVLTKTDDGFNISILNCDDFKKLQEIKNFINVIINLGIQKKEIVKIPAEEKPVIMKQVVQKQTFINEDDIDIDGIMMIAMIVIVIIVIIVIIAIHQLNLLKSLK